ncbi:PREDICTED: glycylpeptide N-tetradecanoyltransferase 2 [Hipposideros armiger]|uniref:Glycylpeptide N-tetradecanoyltransferase n=1 Tax=Hipposideros armiger TaxID=186990 RepID=A0A8B7SZY4_HIPAR|nr:PREDICTED: glycylpeptide N-tetradecanoyltransferase 2 [Hipposideros armiger]
MAEDSESAASQQSLELDDQDTCGIDGDNEEETEHAKGSPRGDLGAKKKKKKQKRKKEKPSSGGTKSDSASDSQEIKIQQPSKHNTIWQQISAGAATGNILSIGRNSQGNSYKVHHKLARFLFPFLSIASSDKCGVTYMQLIFQFLEPLVWKKEPEVGRMSKSQRDCASPFLSKAVSQFSLNTSSCLQLLEWDGALMCGQPSPRSKGTLKGAAGNRATWADMRKLRWEAAEKELEKGTFVEIAGDIDDVNCTASSPDEVITSHGAIEADKDNVRREPYSLPQGFMWDTLELGNAEVLKELYTLLNENYVEDDDNMFRFDYSPEFLLWALRPPGWLLQWHCGVRVSSNKKLVGFISAIPANIRIYDSVKKMVEINFLCVHKKLRSKRVAPVLIREITRRVNLEGIFQAVYTTGVVLPKPVATCRYWHRSLNPRKLVEVKFSHLSRNMTLQRTMKLYRLPDVTKTSGLRPMEPRDIKAVRELTNSYLKRFHLAPVMDEEEVAHWFLPQEHIIDTFVVENSSGKLTDFLSFYTLPSTVMHHPAHQSLKAAYSFYNIHTETPLLDLMNDALIIAKLKGFDVFNALDLMENKTFLEKLKFGIGDGNLHYYLYNWRCPGTDSEKVGLVLQ